MFASKMGCRRKGDEPLRAVGIGSAIGHDQHPVLVSYPIDPLWCNICERESTDPAAFTSDPSPSRRSSANVPP